MLNFFELRVFDAAFATADRQDVLDLVVGEALLQHLAADHPRGAKDQYFHSFLLFWTEQLPANFYG